MSRIAGAFVFTRRARFCGRLRLALAAQRRDDSDQAARERAQEDRQHRERRQERDQHALRVVAHDEAAG